MRRLPRLNPILPSEAAAPSSSSKSSLKGGQDGQRSTLEGVGAQFPLRPYSAHELT